MNNVVKNISGKLGKKKAFSAKNVDAKNIIGLKPNINGNVRNATFEQRSEVEQ